MIPSHLQKLPHIGQQAQALPALAPNMLLLPEQDVAVAAQALLPAAGTHGIHLCPLAAHLVPGTAPADTTSCSCAEMGTGPHPHAPPAAAAVTAAAMFMATWQHQEKQQWLWQLMS
jgi:hypothetical protein